ncbi:MAG TPA: DUF58 domain-containing protein [Archaeoglobaceae archaeon]|nr:DUF58 domain-containing protein [Archaeoglobaceae archaeon]
MFPNEKILTLLAFLLFVQGYLLENVFSALFAFSVIVYLTYLRSEFNPKIEAERRIDNRLVEGLKAKSKLKLRNLTDKKLKIKVLEDFLPRGFKAETPTFILDGKEEKEFEYSIVPVKGVYRIRGPRIRMMDLRELFHADLILDSETEVEVYPSIEGIKAEAEESLKLASMQKALLGLQTIEVHSLREFQPGDDMKHVEWKATARLGELIVKDFLREVEDSIYIILDAGREMRKGVRNSKIDYATALTLQLAYALRKYRTGLIVYDDFCVKYKVEASKSKEQIEKIVRSLKISPMHSDLLGVKLPEISFRLSEESMKFLKKVLPVIKGRRSFVTGLIEAVSSLPSSAFLIFIADITSNTNELIRVLSELRKKHKILLLTPNPVLFYDESKLDKEKLLWLYKRYLGREELIKKLNRIVPTLDLGPSDLLDVIRGSIK